MECDVGVGDDGVNLVKLDGRAGNNSGGVAHDTGEWSAAGRDRLCGGVGGEDEGARKRERHNERNTEVVHGLLGIW